MVSTKATALLQFNCKQVEEVRKLFNYEDSGRLLQDVDAFEAWINKQNHFRIKKFEKEYLERYLIYNKGSIERAKKHFDKVCTLRNLMPDFLQGYDIRNEFIPLFNSVKVGVLCKPTEDNYRVAVVRTEENDDSIELVQYYRYVIVIAEYMLCHDYSAGYEIVADVRNIPLALVTKLNPIVISKALTLIVETMGMRVKKIHFISGSKLFDTVMSLFKRGMSVKLAQRIVIHDSVESIHELISRDILPLEYGGKDKSLNELNDLLFKEVSSDSHVARMKFLESASTDESCRLSVTFNEEYCGMPGSFKRLCVD